MDDKLYCKNCKTELGIENIPVVEKVTEDNKVVGFIYYCSDCIKKL